MDNDACPVDFASVLDVQGRAGSPSTSKSVDESIWYVRHSVVVDLGKILRCHNFYSEPHRIHIVALFLTLF